MTRRDALPVEAVRDLLGIARVMYAARKREGVMGPALEELAEVGKKLKVALDLARRTDPDTVGHRAAWTHAENATSALMKMITVSTPAAPIVEAAAVRIRRLGRQPPSERDEKRLAAKSRN
jgi:hypothetical protein